jgi:hypothetical protein
MKKLLVVVASICLFGSEIGSISDIKEEFRDIESNIANFSKKSRLLDDLSTEGAKVTYYKDKNGNIVLIKVDIFGEMGKAERKYYFKDGKLFFLYEVDYRYTMPIYLPEFDMKKSKITYNRYYFFNNKMQQWIKNKKKINPSSKEFIERSKEIYDSIRDIKQ